MCFKFCCGRRVNRLRVFPGKEFFRKGKMAKFFEKKSFNSLLFFEQCAQRTTGNCPRCQIVLGSRCSRGSCSINKTSNFLFQMTKSLVFLRLPQQLFRKGKITKSLASFPENRGFMFRKGKMTKSLEKNSFPEIVMPKSIFNIWGK